MPWIIRKRENEWCVYKRGQDGEPTGDALGCHESEDGARKQMAALHANVAEFTLSELREHEFKGQFPDVPTYAHVDVDLLHKNDPDPFYVVLPVARVGEVSANGLVYDEELVSEIEAQLPGLGGIRGHNFDATAFPVESHDVVGHVREGDTLWAKLYVPPGEGREDMRRRKARGGKVGTSILGKFAKRIAEANGQWRAKGLKLESLDLGPITRTALNLGGAFAVVSELSDTVEDGMDKEQVIAELTPGDLPQALRDAIIREHEAASETDNVVAELRAELSDKAAVIAELTGKIDQFKREAFEHRLDGRIAEMVQVEKLRPIVRRAVLATLPADASDEQAEKALAEYLDGDEYQPLARAMVAELSGPHAFVGGKGADNWRDELAKNAPEIAKKLGVAR